MFKNKYVFIRNLSVFLLVCEIMSGLFPFPPGIWRIGFVLTSFYTIIFKERKRLPCENFVLLFALFNLVHFFVSFIWINPSTSQIGNILCGMLSLSLFTLLAQKGVMTDKYINAVCIVFIIASIYKYYHQIYIVKVSRNENDVDFTNNTTVCFLMLLPMLFLLKNNIIKWVSLLVCIVFIVMGAKRGNILASVIPVVLFLYSMFRNSRRSVIKIVFTLIFIMIGSYIVYRFAMTNDYLMLRFVQTSEMNSSGRDDIFVNAWNAWNDSQEIRIYLFGYGFDGTVNLAQMNYFHAHNDWLEILVDYGLLGIVLYLLIFASMIKQTKKIKVFDSKLVLISALLIWFFKTLYSMGFTESAMSLLMISVGKVLGDYKVEKGI